MLFILALICIILLVLRRLLWGRNFSSDALQDNRNAEKIDHLKRVGDHHELASILSQLVEEDGAGAWPPRANHDAWPQALRPYKDIYLELNPLLPSATASLDDNTNNEKRHLYRSSMRKLLAERIDTTEVVEILSQFEKGNWKVLPRDQYNGFYCCVAVLRHAYRWATIPVVKVAQLEKEVDFPMELDLPWPYLQRKFGVSADSGNNTANVLHNFNESGQRVYLINVGMSDVIRSSEEAFFRMFYDLEVLAFPVYYHMVMATFNFHKNNKAACLQHLQHVTYNVRNVLLVFYEGLTNLRVSHSVWLSYVQGFQGWGVGRMINGEYVKYDGLSGNHVLFFQAVDAFLGMGRYLTDENMDRYIPVNQRSLCLALRRNCFRAALDENPDKENALIAGEITKIVNHVKVFRAAHRARVMTYLEQPAPERLIMTAGKSVLEGSDTKDVKQALKVLDDMMAQRLKETL